MLRPPVVGTAFAAFILKLVVSRFFLILYLFYVHPCLEKKNQKIFNLVLINQTEWSKIACPRLIRFLNGGKIEGTNRSSKTSFMSDQSVLVHVGFPFYVCGEVIGLLGCSVLLHGPVIGARARACVCVCVCPRARARAPFMSGMPS